MIVDVPQLTILFTSKATEIKYTASLMMIDSPWFFGWSSLVNWDQRFKSVFKTQLLGTLPDGCRQIFELPTSIFLSINRKIVNLPGMLFLARQQTWKRYRNWKLVLVKYFTSTIVVWLAFHWECCTSALLENQILTDRNTLN